MSAPLPIVIVARDQVPHVKLAGAEVRRFLEQRPDVEILAFDAADQLDFSQLEPELVVVLGGDGAILRACRQMGAKQHPILGINLGRLGFLADLAQEEFVSHFPQIVNRQYRVVHHLMYDCTLTRADGTQESHLGLNEVVVSAGASFHIMEVELEIDHEPVTTFTGDGLIVSTPVGSTAHSLSAGGPILHQELQGFVITPICPHTLTVRPVVDSADRLYTLRLPQVQPGVMLVIDGQIQLPLHDGDRIDIRRAAVTFQLAKVAGHSYYGTLHRKLGWAGQPQYRRR